MVAEKQYKISEMTKLIKVEAHVLRYWEEELQLPIKRNDLGHRYYTQDDVERFCAIKKWKESGIQLKGIRSMLDLQSDKTDKLLPVDVTGISFPVDITERNLTTSDSCTSTLMHDKKEEKAYRLQMLLKGLIKEAVLESNAQMADDIKESIIKEMDYQFRIVTEEQEKKQNEYIKQQEEYFTKLDHMIQENIQNRKKKVPRLFQLKTRG